MGSGRQAIRVLLQSMSVHAERLAMSALQELHALSCSKLADLEGVLVKFAQLRRRASIRPSVISSKS